MAWLPTGRLSHRPGDLNGARVLLYDNGKLHRSFGEYRAVFDVLTEELHRDFPEVRIVRRTEALLTGDLTRLSQWADDIGRVGAQAVILALCDTGVTQATMLLAVELEARGIPTSSICQGIGFRIAASTAARLLPGLPLSAVKSTRLSSYDDVAAEAAAIARDVINGLVGSPSTLIGRSHAYPTSRIVPATPSGTIEIGIDEPEVEFTRLMMESGLGDGLPLVAPYPERVAGMLAEVGAAGTAVIWPSAPQRAKPLTARDIAVVAVMAGCEPRVMPVVLTAYRAMADPRFRLFQAAVTTHPGGTLVLVSGPATKHLGLASGAGCLGPGFRSNATVGRAVSLAYSFFLDARIGASDLSVQGSPAEYSYCCAENVDASPWEGLHTELIGPEATSVTVLKCEGPHAVIDNLSTSPEGLLRTVASAASTLGSNNAYNAGAQTVIFLSPEHAALVAAAGWNKADVKNFLFEIIRHDRSDLVGRGNLPYWPKWFDSLSKTPIANGPEDILVVVAGDYGPHSQVALPWGHSRGVTLPL